MAQDLNIHKKKSFIERYTYAFIIGSIALALALIVTFITIGSQPNLAVNAPAIVFDTPVANATVIKDYSGTELQYNPTLKQWEAHKAIDFKADSASQVVAVCDGKVIEANKNYLDGYYVVIEHSNGLKTVYKSLDKTLKVKKGDVVKKGTVLGTVSTSAAIESSVGAHLHFEVKLNDKLVDPNGYFKIDK